MPDLLQKLRDMAAMAHHVDATTPRPLETVFDEVLNPCEVMAEGRRTLVFGSNNYFGLTCHPEVIAAAKAALDKYGSATTGSRIASGTLAIHRDLEHELAAAYGRQQAVVFTTGYQGNLAVVGALCGEGDFVLLDADSHASLYDASRLCGATIIGFRHNSPESLAKRLVRLPGGSKNRLVAIEGLYSIQGDIAPLAEFVRVCKEHNAYLMVDEAHSIGVYGARGLGCAEDQGVLDDVDFIVGTFSKTLAGVGGFVVSNHPELEALHMLARPYLFTASGSPANIAGVRAALAIMLRDRDLAKQVWRVVHRLRDGLAGQGFQLGATASPIVPVLIGDLHRTRTFWRAALDAGLYANVVLPPACPANACLLRMSCSSAHTDAHVDTALDIMGRVGRELGVIA